MQKTRGELVGHLIFDDNRQQVFHEHLDDWWRKVRAVAFEGHRVTAA